MRKFLVFLVLFLAIAVAAVVSVWAFLPGWAKGQLASAGLGDLDFDVDSLSVRRLSIVDIRFGLRREQRLDRVTFSFRPTRLLRGHPVDEVLIEGADLRLLPQQDGFPRLAGLAPPDRLGESNGLTLPPIPVARVVLRDVLVQLEAEAGVLRAPLSGTLTQADSGTWTLAAETALRYREAEAKLAFQAEWNPDGSATIQGDLAGARGWIPAVSDALVAGRVTLDRQDSGRLSASGRLELDAADFPLVVDFQADRSEATDSPVSFALGLDASELSLSSLGDAAGIDAVLVGGGSVRAQLEGSLPFKSAPHWQSATASGHLSLLVEDGAVPGAVTNLDAAVKADLSLSGASLAVVPSAPWELTGVLVALGVSPAFRIANSEEEGLELRFDTDLGRGSAAGGFDFVLEIPDGQKVAGTAYGSVERAPGKALQFDLERLHARSEVWNLNDLEIGVSILDARLKGTASRAEGQISALLGVSGALGAGNRVTAGEFSFQGRLTYADGTLGFEAEDCVGMQAEGLELGAIQWLRPIDVCARPPEGEPILRLSDSGDLWLAMSLPGHPVTLAIGHGRSPLEVTGTMPEATLSAAFDARAELRNLQLETRGGRLKLSEPAVELSEIEISLTRDESTSLVLKSARARSLSKPADFAPLTLEGKADGRMDGAMTFEIDGRGQGAPLDLKMRGEHDFALALGEMSYELGKMRFSAGGPQPGDYFPAAGKLIRNAQGSLSLSGNLSWIADVPASRLQIGLRDLGFDAPGLLVRGINTRLQRAGPTVRNGLAAQEVRIDALDIGIPLRDGLIRFHTRKAPTVRIEKIRFAWGGGLLLADPFDLRLGDLASRHDVALEFLDVKLSALLDLIPIDGLQGTGTLSGRVPLRIRGSEVMVEAGSIGTDVPGVLRYRPEEKPGFFDNSSHTQLLFRALQDFRYDSLTIGVNGKTRDDLQLRISLSGSNPDLYDGHPFKLNFNISGEIDTIIQRSLSAATFAERFGELISRYLQ